MPPAQYDGGRQEYVPDQQPGMMDDTEDPELELTATEDVYSYFMFIAPTEEKKEGTSRTLDTLVAYLLVTLNIVFQAILLYAIFYRVVLKTSEWRSGITEFAPSSGWNLMGKVEGCNDGSSMCVLEGPNVTCAPPSVQLTSRWDELDLNGDGVWTREECETAREDLKCKYVVDPLEVFDVFVKTVVNREGIIWVHPDLKAGKVIHKPYFTYAAGDIIMCGYRNKDMCGNVLQRGFFDAALEHNTVPRVGNTINSAMKYCYDLLKPGGFCDITLPSTYAVWKIEATQECLDAEYTKFVYTHPKTNVQKANLAVDYDARQSYEMSKTSLFRFFLFIVLSIWTLSMVYEFKQIVIVFTWVKTFPSSKEFSPGEAVTEIKEDDGSVTYEIRGIDPGHRTIVCFITILRTIMLLILSWVGMSLLLKSTSYMDLVMDAVGLVFILEIAGLLYTQILRPQIREQTESLKPMVIQAAGWDWLNRRPALLDLLWLSLVFIIVLTLMYFHYTTTVDPMYKALECACIGVGAGCREANQFSKVFWDNYWQVETPKVFADVEKLKGGAALLQAKHKEMAKIMPPKAEEVIKRIVNPRPARRRNLAAEKGA